MPSKPATKPPAASARSGDRGHARRECIVVGYDGSPEARYAAAWAARRLGRDGKLVLVNASGPRRRWLPQAILATAGERRNRGGALIDELLMDGEQALLDVHMEASVRDEEPARALIEAAREHGAREIVVGSHHRSRLDAVYGDVAAELVRSAPVPVCVVPLGGEPS